MGERLELWAYKSIERRTFQEALALAAASTGASVRPLGSGSRFRGGTVLKLGHSGSGVSSIVAEKGGPEPSPYRLYMALASALNCTVLTARIHEGAIWDYVLYSGTEIPDLWTWAGVHLEHSTPFTANSNRSEVPGILTASWLR